MSWSRRVFVDTGPWPERPSRFIEADAFRKERRSLSLAGVAPPHPVSNEAVPALVGCLLDSLQADLRGEKECRQQDKRECRYGGHTATPAIDARHHGDHRPDRQRDDSTVRPGREEGCDQEGVGRNARSEMARPTRCPDEHDRDEVVIRGEAGVAESQRGSAALAGRLPGQDRGADSETHEEQDGPDDRAVDPRGQERPQPFGRRAEIGDRPAPDEQDEVLEKRNDSRFRDRAREGPEGAAHHEEGHGDPVGEAQPMAAHSDPKEGSRQRQRDERVGGRKVGQAVRYKQRRHRDGCRSRPDGGTLPGQGSELAQGDTDGRRARAGR